MTVTMLLVNTIASAERALARTGVIVAEAAHPGKPGNG
jgi:hypothetical protein